MSRAEKEQRRRRRRERKARQSAHRGRLPVDQVDAYRVDPSRVVRLLSYEITTERLRDIGQDIPGLDEVLSEDDRATLFEQIHDEPRVAIERLTDLTGRFPGAALLTNWLAMAYTRAGEHERAERLALLNYERHPDYLFAKLNYAQICLSRGDLERVAAIFDQKFDLQLLYPHRAVFHISEFIGFAAIMVEYHMRTGDLESAEMMYDLMEEMAPDAEATRQIGDLLATSLLLRTLKGMFDLIRPRRRKLR